MLDTFFKGWDPAYLASQDGQRDIEDLVFRRYDECLTAIVPWIERHMPLKGRTVVEIGCGAGCSTSAIARLAAHVHGYDIDARAIDAARRRTAALKQTNITLHLHPPQDIIEALNNHAGADAILLYAVLEHQTIPERLEAIRACWDLLAPGGLMIVVETPNRLAYFDPHTALLPFFFQLPEQLAIQYAARSPRAPFVQSMADELKLSEARAVESLARWGRGVSFHEFELALGDLSSLVIGDGYDPEILKIRPIHTPERCLYTYWKHANIQAPVGFVRQDLDLILRKPGGPAMQVRERELPIHELGDPLPPLPPKRHWWSR
jgi:2-polyprenyl-3-methyl-5-hydroxy-6-metoxy-1,4-benzoquinol methylase